jgi:tetratricopeptide (TPR) repeat protein
MKKYFVLAIALTLGFSVVAQKKELKAANKEIDKGNFEKATVALDAAETLLGSMDEKYKSQYFLLRSICYLKNGDPDFNTIKKSIEALKLATEPEQGQGVKNQIQNLKAHLVNKGSSLWKKKDYKTSSDYFESAYKLVPSDTVYLFNAAISANNAKLYDRSLAMYEELRSLGYTGIEQNYFAINKETQVEELFGSKDLRDLSVKFKSHINPRDETTKSKFPGIIKNIALIYVQNGENEKALQAMAVARAESPDDLDLVLTEANVYYKLGDVNKSEELYKLAIDKNPLNPDLYFNLGVINSDTNNYEKSKKYYLKAIELKPEYKIAHINLASVIEKQAIKYYEDMNKLGTSKADDLKYEEFKSKRKLLYLELLSHLLKALELAPNDYYLTRDISITYSNIGDDVKYNEYKVLADALEPK